MKLEWDNVKTSEVAAIVGRSWSAESLFGSHTDDD